MPNTQENSPIAIDTPLGKDILFLRGFTGQESISRLFAFELDLLSTNRDIKFEDIVGKRISVRLSLGMDKKRYFNGFMSRFMQTGEERELATYRATMVPWFWFLTRTADCRTFQNMTIPDILLKIFDNAGFKDVRSELQGIWEPVDYCVQYRETDFSFVSRLMEQHGMFYFFEHEERKHTLVLADQSSSHKPCPETASARWKPEGSAPNEADVIHRLQIAREFRAGKYTLTDYNFEMPSTSLMATVGGDDAYEMYDYPGEYEKKVQGDRLAKTRIEEEEAQSLTLRGTGACRTFAAGYAFDFKEYFRKDMNQAYVLTQVHHTASIGEAGGRGSGGQEHLTYTNTFTAIPRSVPYRPERLTPRPIVQGPQTAVVVGPVGEEIHVDQYGRVKVQFFWDREGNKNEASSCWVRVSQLWAGKQWGAMFIPRIGQEVIVEFLEGDPDHPIITGRVYNAEQMPPYALPAQQTQSGIKSRSSKGGGPANFNELRFEDKIGNEEIYLHAEKTLTIEVEQDESRSVGHDATLKVGNHKTLTVGGNHSETVSGNETITVSADSAHTTGRSQVLTIGAAYHVSVGGAMKETVGAARTEETGAAKSVTVGRGSSEHIGTSKSVDAGGDISENAGKNISLKAGKDVVINAGKSIAASAGENISESAGKDAAVKAGKKLVLDAGDEITIQTGSAKIHMKKSGDIVIEGKKISLKASGDLVLKGRKIQQN
ncbi:MAG: type VI secretion system tip protein VgrG [Nitrospira sp.]